jgi:hypothetical protein
MKARLSVATLLIVSSALPDAASASNCTRDGFLPKNTLSISSAHGSNGMDEKRFNDLIEKVEVLYKPIVAQQGAQLVFERLWSDGTVNAYASRRGNQWVVSMYGGLARHSAVTPDGFSLVVCHEVGHHLGGAPKYRGEWAANEGQADYFSTLKCLRNVFEKDDNISIVKQLSVPESVTRACESSFGDAASIALCQRTSMAGRSTGELMRLLGGSPPIDFTTPDPSQVSSTQDAHPAAQCRLDTYFNGSICQVDKSEPVSSTDPTVGTCAEEKNYKTGYRPRCWYKPSSGGGDPDPDPNPPTQGIARAPTFSGQNQLVVRNPYGSVSIEYDVSAITGSAGIYFEVSRPNQAFSEPNSTKPEPNVTTGFSRAGSTGQLWLVPAQHLPGWATYQMRVIALDASGRVAMSRFSNSSTLTWSARRRGLSSAYQSTPPAR